MMQPSRKRVRTVLLLGPTCMRVLIQYIGKRTLSLKSCISSKDAPKAGRMTTSPSPMVEKSLAPSATFSIKLTFMAKSLSFTSGL